MNVKPLEFTVNGLKLRGQIYFAEKPKNLAILFLHGWTGPTNGFAAENMAKNGFTSMIFSLSGHNDSEGKLEDQTREKSLQEILAAYDLFKKELPPNSQIAAVGNSYGGYFAAVLSAERPLAAISMRVPANYRDDLFNEQQLKQSGDIDEDVMKWRQLPLGKEDTRALRAVSNFDAPIQIIEAENDEFVPHQTVQNYVDAVKDKSQLDYHFMKGWPHSIGDSMERNKQFQQILLKWAKSVKNSL